MDKTLGQIAYEAYCELEGFRTPWSEISLQRQSQFEHIAQAVARVCRGRSPMAEAWGPRNPRTDHDQTRDIPASCTCTWTWGPPSFRWVRIGPKEDCPWHVHNLWITPEWLDQ